MRVRLQRQRIRVWVKCQAGSSHSVPFSVFIRMLRICKRLHQRPTHRMHLGKGNAGIGRPVHTINLTATASGIPIGALQLPSQVDLLAFFASISLPSFTEAFHDANHALIHVQ